MHKPSQLASPPIKCGACDTREVEWKFLKTEISNQKQKVLACQKCHTVLTTEDDYLAMSSIYNDPTAIVEAWVIKTPNLSSHKGPDHFD